MQRATAPPGDSGLSAVDDILTEGEVLHATWAPSFGQFIRRFIIVGLLTSLGLGGATYSFGLAAWLTTTAIALLAYGFIFDDYAIWMRCRRDQWALTNRRLIYIDDAEIHMAVSVPLTDINAVKRSMWGSLVISLANRQKITISYLAAAKDAQSRIIAAVSFAKPPKAADNTPQHPTEAP